MKKNGKRIGITMHRRHDGAQELHRIGGYCMLIKDGVDYIIINDKRKSMFMGMPMKNFHKIWEHVQQCNKDKDFDVKTWEY